MESIQYMYVLCVIESYLNLVTYISLLIPVQFHIIMSQHFIQTRKFTRRVSKRRCVLFAVVWREPGVIIRRVLFAAGWHEPRVVCYHI